MKIRNGFVSNSSSSSFVINNLTDVNQLKTAINNWVDQIDYNSEDNKYYNVTKQQLLDCFNKKLEQLNNKQEQDDLLNVYVQGAIASILYSGKDYLKDLRDYQLSECEKCELYKTDFKKGRKRGSKCSHCFHMFQYEDFQKEQYELKHNLAVFTHDKKELDFDVVLEKIREIVYSAPTKKMWDDDNESVVDLKYEHYDQYFDQVINDYFNKWIDKYPNSCVLSFASDDGDHVEGFIRMMINDFVYFMTINGINGFRGENS